MGGRRTLLLCLFAVGSTYALTLARNHAEAEDSLHYAVVAGRAEWTDELRVHGNHLLFAPLGHAAVALQRVLAPGRTPEIALQGLNVLVALACIPILWSLVPAPRPARVAVVLLFAFSYGVWRYATESDVYLPPIFCMLLVWREVAATLRDPARPFGSVRVGALCGLAILCHQRQVFTLVVAALAVARAGLRRPVVLVGVAGVVLVAGYGTAAAWMGVSDAAGVVDWLAGSEAGHYGQVSLGSLLRGAAGFGRAWIGGHFAFALPGVPAALEARLTNTMLREELALARAFSPFGAVTLLAITGMGSIAAGLFLFRSWHHRSRARLSDVIRRVVLPSAVVYALFALWWDPDNLEFWLPVVPAVALLFGAALHAAASDGIARRAAVFAIASLVVVNLFGSMRPQQDRRYDYWWTATAPVRAHAKRGDLVVTASGWVARGYIELYAGADVFSTLRDGESLRTDFGRAVSTHASGRVFVSSSVSTPPPELLEWRGLDARAAQGFFEELAPDLVEVEAGTPYDLFEWRGERSASR